MKQPLAGVALLFAAGIFLGRYSTLPLAWMFGATLVLGAGACVARRRPEVWFALFLVFSGWTNVAWRLAVLAPDDLRRRVPGAEQLATVRGVLEQRPEERLRRRESEWTTNTLALLRCEAVCLDGGAWRSAHGRVMVQTPGPLSSAYRQGTSVVIDGVLRRPSGPAAPGLFDYAEHLAWRGIYFELRTSTADDWALDPGSQPAGQAWTDRFQDWALRALGRGMPADDEELRLLRAMVLGWKTGLTDEVEEPFMRSGTLHLFAISGLHIALVAYVVVELLRLVQMPRLAVGLVVIPVVWFYTAATGWQSSAVRATVMTSVVVGGWMLARPVRVLNSVATAGWAILLWEPRQLFQAGFQLSFAVVASLALLLPGWEALGRRWRDEDPFLPAGLESRWRRALRRQGWRLGGAVAVSLAAWVGSAPLTAHYFHLVTPASLLANVVIVPLSGAALASSVGSLLCEAWLPGASVLLNHSAWFWMHLMLETSRFSADLPWGCWHVRRPPLAATCLWYLAVVVAGMGSGLWHQRPWRRGLMAAAVFLGVLAMHEWHRLGGRQRLVVLPLRGGHAVWVDRAGDSTLIDTGDSAMAESLVAPFLQAQGVNRLRLLALSHGDVRHVGGASGIASRFRPHRILVSPVRFRSTAYTRALEDLRGTHANAWTPGAAGDSCEGWTILHPASSDRAALADDACLAIETVLGGVRVLCVADLSRRGQELLGSRHPDLRADIVITGLPERGDPMTEGWLEAMGVRLVVVADSLHPATARARRPLKERLRAGRVPVVFTSELGAVELRLTKGTWRVLDATGRDRGRGGAAGSAWGPGLRGSPGRLPPTGAPG